MIIIISFLHISFQQTNKHIGFSNLIPTFVSSFLFIVECQGEKRKTVRQNNVSFPPAFYSPKLILLFHIIIRFLFIYSTVPTTVSFKGDSSTLQYTRRLLRKRPLSSAL